MSKVVGRPPKMCNAVRRYINSAKVSGKEGN
jgi:hypothetical protein